MFCYRDYQLTTKDRFDKATEKKRPDASNTTIPAINLLDSVKECDEWTDNHPKVQAEREDFNFMYDSSSAQDSNSKGDFNIGSSNEEQLEPLGHAPLDTSYILNKAERAPTKLIQMHVNGKHDDQFMIEIEGRQLHTHWDTLDHLKAT